MTNCPLVVRKSAAGWDRVADGVAASSAVSPCAQRPGTLFIGSGRGGWLVDIAPSSTTEYVAVHNRTNRGALEGVYLTTIRVTESGYSSEQSLLPLKSANSAAPKVATSLWRGNDETWFTAWGLVVRRSDDGTLAISTIARAGAPVNAPFYRIRGTSNQNLWAIGARHAYHKTTP